jgi:hypothetical protein
MDVRISMYECMYIVLTKFGVRFALGLESIVGIFFNSYSLKLIIVQQQNDLYIYR